MSDVLGTQQVSDYFFAVTLCYLGFESHSFDCRGRLPLFTIVCPAEECEELRLDYIADRLVLSSAQALGRIHSRIGRLVRDARKNGVYVNQEGAFSV